MSKNLIKKGLAFGAVLSLGVTGLTGIAASAATGDVTLAPKTGTGTTAFATDAFTLSNKVKTSVVSGNTLAYRIDNPDQNTLKFTLTGGTPVYAKVVGINSAGASVTINSGAVTGPQFAIDFAFHEIVSLVIYDIRATGDSGTLVGANADLAVELVEDATTTSTSDFDGNVTSDRYEFGELTASTTVDVQAWIETTVGATESSYKTVEADFASTKQSVTFIDSSTVNVISKIERGVFTVNNKLTSATTTVRAAGSGDSASTTAFNPGDTFQGLTLATGDRILLTDTNVSAAHGIYTVAATGAMTATDTTLTGDIILSLEGTNRGVVYNASHTTALAGTVASATNLNAGNDNVLAGSLDFSNQALNLTQVDLAQWEVAVVSTSTDDVAYGSAGILQVGVPAGYSASDSLGRLFIQAPVADLNLNDAETYSLKFRHSGDTVAPIVEASSAGYQVVESPSTTAVEIKAAPTVTADATLGTTYSSGYDVAIRNGVGAVTYKSTILDSSDAAVLAANVPVLAVVTAGANFPTGATLQVSGATETIKVASATQIVTGLTDASGNWSVTVTSSDTSAAGSAYTIQFYVLSGATPDAWNTADGTSTNNAIYKADYASAAQATFAADSTVLSGASATVTFTVKDQFGQPLSATSAGKAYSVELKAADKTNLEQYVAVVGGKATFTIKNYLAAGGSEILTAKLFTGTSTSPTYVATEYVTLYNTNAVAGVNVVTEVTGVEVSYEDFISGASSATNVAPGTSGAVDFTYTGTVVDANGAGVPGAPVTLSGTGFQFAKTGTTTYYVDSITTAANEAGTFSITVWTHTLSATGNVLTVKSGDKSATTKVKSVLPSALSAKNVAFSWTAAPALPVVNTTYVVSATVADKWNNPIAGASVSFDGYGSATFNGVSTTVTKVTDKAGKALVYLRSLKDIDGISSIAVSLADTVVAGHTWGDLPSSVYTDSTSTKWDESKWTNVLEASVDFFAKKPTATVSAGSKKANVVVKNASGATVTVVSGTKSVTKVATSDSFKVSLTKLTAGKKTVKVYVNDVLVSSKSVTVKK